MAKFRIMVVAVAIIGLGLACLREPRVLAGTSNSANVTMKVSPVHSADSEPGPATEASTQPFTLATVKINASTQAVPEANLTGSYTCTASVTYKTLQATDGYVFPPSDAVVTVIPTSQPSISSSFTLQAVLPTPGYYQIAISSPSDVLTDTEGNTYSGSAGPKYLYVVVYTCDLVWSGSNSILDSATNQFVASGSSVVGKTCDIAVGEDAAFSATFTPRDGNFDIWQIGGAGSKTLSDFRTLSQANWWNPGTWMPSTTQCSGTPVIYYDRSYPSTNHFYWWTTKGQPSSNEDCAFDIYFGTTKVTKKATMIVQSPTTQPSPTTLPSVSFVYDGKDILGTYLFSLKYGPQASPLRGGIEMPADLLETTGFYWTPNFVQIENSQNVGIHYLASATGGASAWSISGSAGTPLIDTTYPYGLSPIQGGGALGFSDSPGLPNKPLARADGTPLCDALFAHMEFVIYELGIPASANAIHNHLNTIDLTSSNPVPLNSVKWHWGGQVTLGAGTDPRLLASWILNGNYCGVTAISSAPPGSFYSWTNNVQYVGWITH